MRFSIIVPVYDTEKYLDNCICSVLKQDFEDFELILVNDGSTDSSFQICETYYQKDSRVRIFNQMNSGQSATRNYGLRNAEGEYVIFLDSDDYWTDSALLCQLNNRIEQTQSDVLSFNFCKVIKGKEGKKYFGLNEDMPYELSERECIKFMADNGIWVSSPWNKAIRRKLFEEYDLYFREGINAEDIDWSTRLALAAKKFDYLNVLGLAYVQREGSISHSMSLEKIIQLKENVALSEKLIARASDIKKIMLDPYLAYQIGVLLINMASLNEGEEKEKLKQSLKPMLHYLAYTSDKRLKILNVFIKYFGLSISLRVIKLVY